MTDCKSHHRHLLPTGVDQDVAALPGIVPHAIPPGTPWNWTAIRLDQRCPIPPGITPGLKDCPSPLSSLESPGLGRLSARIDIAPLAWYNTRPQDSTFLAAASGGYIHTTRYCVCLAENSFIPPGIVHRFQRTVFIPPGIVRMFQRTVLIPPGIVRIFREQFLYHLVL